MASELQSLECVRFADFEFDCRNGDLRRDGSSLKLQPQPAKILAVLVRRAGQVVTRQELAEQVWGSETFVDFEQGLNYAIRQIRTALEDDADRPRFLETLPKRGYRFIAPLDDNAVVHTRRLSNHPIPERADPPKNRRADWTRLLGGSRHGYRSHICVGLGLPSSSMAWRTGIPSN